MDLMSKIKIYKHDIVSIKKDKKGYYVVNDTDEVGCITFFKTFLKNTSNTCNVKFEGTIVSGDAPELKMVNRKKRVVNNVFFNSDNYFEVPNKLFMMAIKVMPRSKFYIKKLSVDFNVDSKKVMENHFSGDILLIAPGYPNHSNKYLFGFVHTRVLEYKKQNMNVDVAYLNDNPEYCYYNYEGINVNKISFFDLRNVLQVKRYNKIIIV